MEEPSRFSVGQTAQSLTCSILEKPHTGLDDSLRILPSCFRKRMSAHGVLDIPQGYHVDSRRSDEILWSPPSRTLRESWSVRVWVLARSSPIPKRDGDIHSISGKGEKRGNCCAWRKWTFSLRSLSQLIAPFLPSFKAQRWKGATMGKSEAERPKLKLIS